MRGISQTPRMVRWCARTSAYSVVGAPQRHLGKTSLDRHLGCRGEGRRPASPTTTLVSARARTRPRRRTWRPVCAAATADLLFTTERSAGENLAREGIDAAGVHFVGNTMIDTLERLLPQARGGEALARLRLSARGYGLVTLHRPSNVDDAAQLEALVACLLYT